MTVSLNAKLAAVTERIVRRSREERRAYLERIEAAARSGPGRAKLSCANWAHAFAAAPAEDKLRVMSPETPNIGVVTAYNDMLSAHQPFEHYPELIRQAGIHADRISINVELPTDAGLMKLAPEKDGGRIEGAMRDMKSSIADAGDAARRYKSAPKFAPAGQ